MIIVLIEINTVEIIEVESNYSGDVKRLAEVLRTKKVINVLQQMVNAEEMIISFVMEDDLSN